MRKVLLALGLFLLGLLALAACAKAEPTATPRPATPTPPPPTVAPTLRPGVTPTATPVPTATIPAGQIPFSFPKGEAAPGLYKTYEEAVKDWPNVIAAAKKEGRLLVSLFSAPAPGTWTDRVLKAFQEKYGIQTEFIAGRTAEQLAKIQAEKATGRHTLDGYFSGPTAVRPICAEGFCVPFVTPNALEPGVSWIVSPLAEGVHLATAPGGGAPGGQVYLWQRNSTVINTDKEPDQTKWPKKFADLEDPYWKGKLAMEDVRNMGPIADYWDYSTRPEGVAAGLGERHLQALVKNLGRLYVGSTATMEAIAKGAQSAAFMINTSAAYTFTLLPQPWPWRFLEMQEGEMGWVVSASLWKEAPHPNAIKLLADFYISKEGQELGGQTWGQGILRKDVKVVWEGVAPAKIFPVDYGDPKYTLQYTPQLVREKATKWLADAGF